jgi:uncharacterized protein YqjF (DUF2071 family)
MARCVSTARTSRSALGFLPVRASLRVRDLLIASWETDRESLDNVLPQDVEATPAEDRFRIGLAAFQVEGGRVGRLPVPAYAQLNVRTDVTWKSEPAVFFVASRVTAGGLPGALFGAPVRYARLRVEEGAVTAPGRGVRLRYRVGAPADPGPLRDVGLFENDGLRAFRIERGETGWQRAELLEPAELEFLFALGFHPHGDPELLYAARSSFAFEVPSRPKSGKDPYD